MKILEKDNEVRWYPIAKKDEVTCDRRDCAVYSHFYKCYNARQRLCTLYRRWVAECDKLREEETR